jgi:tetratricopeptide (TPR) repeat protein
LGRLLDNTSALAWLDAERANLVAVVAYAAEHGPRQAAWLLADALRCYFVRRMYTVDGLAVAHAGLAAAQADGEGRAEAAARLSFADFHARQGRYLPAVEHCTQALTHARRTGWLDGQATALGKLGIIYWQLGRLQEAAEQYTEALTIDRTTGRRSGQAVRLNNLGTVCSQLGRLAEAADHQSEALALN